MNQELRKVFELGLKPGDTIVTPKSEFNLVQHHALYIGSDDYGSHYITENIIGKGVSLTRLSSFFANRPKVTRINRLKATAYQRRRVVEMALSKVGKPYDLINYNCEHFVTEVTTNRPISKQVSATIGVVGLGLLFGFLIKN
ncbi:lecithin retinol acyltransferase family protein [Adhaeribacter soli]|nr:lecithin retinol acyltransferase family protein [Adhaeribacter soli]